MYQDNPMNKILIIVTLCILKVAPAFSSTINIPTDYPTIQGGIDASSDGDTVLIGQGIYYENLLLEKEIVYVEKEVEKLVEKVVEKEVEKERHIEMLNKSIQTI